ncbi:polysaccharide deacetylase family protein, partial [Streptomyces sp. NPDC058605]
LSHDAGGDRSQSVRALRAYLPQLLDSGYFVTVPERHYA